MKPLSQIPNSDIQTAINNTEVFTIRWLTRLTINNSEELLKLDATETVDYFFTLFICYNNFYNALCNSYFKHLYENRNKIIGTQKNKKIIIDKVESPRGLGDAFKAHTGMFNIMSPLTPSTSEADNLFNISKNVVNEIIDILRRHPHLYIDKENDGPDYSRQIKRALNNKPTKQDQLVSLHNILRLTYKVRCNMFHGSKSYQMDSISILKPLNTILYDILGVLTHKPLLGVVVSTMKGFSEYKVSKSNIGVGQGSSILTIEGIEK